MFDRESPSSPSRLFAPPAVFGLLAAFLVCVMRAVLDDGDTYTHIAAGQWMLDHRSVLRWDPFSATFAGQPWVAHEWLSEVLLGLAHRLAGLTGVVLLTAAAVAVAFTNLARHVGRWCGWRETMLLTAAALVCIMPSILARPHMLALPILEWWVAGLLIARQEGRTPSGWLLPPMMVWANLHGSFAFGLAMTVAFAAEASWEPVGCRGQVRSWWLFVAGAFGAALLTPQGWHGLLFPYRLLQLHSLDVIKEWQPINFATEIGFDAVSLGLVALLGMSRIRVPIFRSVMLAGLLYLAVAHSRHVVLFGVAGSLILAEPVGRSFAGAQSPKLGRRGWAVCCAGLVLLAVLRLTDPVANIDSPAAPVSAMAQLPPDVARRRVLNSNQFGGYLELAGFRPFVDGRVELFGDAFIDEYLAMSQADGRSLRRGVDRYGIEWALLAVNDPLVARFDGLAGWRRQYADAVAVVFVRG